MKKVTLKAPAKINLFLKILGDRTDGFTEICTLMQAISLYDIITVEKADSGLTLSSNDKSIPLDFTNTVAKAWAVLCQTAGIELGAKIHIEKKIPSEAGLGGGSSDAASALIGLSKIYELELSKDIFVALGSVVGSDIPFFLSSGSSLAEGRGEKVADIELPMDYSLLIVKPSYGMKTSEAYSITKKRLTNRNAEFNIKGLNLCNVTPDVLRTVGNDLECAFFEVHPEAEEIKKRLSDAGATYSALSGSGSAFFGIFEDIESARAAKPKFADVWNAAVYPVKLGFES
jgi:4-diphosphocytidyl-2-C-methyl-D-erythritol kinase